MPRADKKIKIFGEVFSAGIWIYIVDVKLYHERQFLYVGKTGYKKIPRDSSPWSRLAAHLDDTADKNNCLLTHIKRAGLDITQCTFELSCFGPDLLLHGAPNTKTHHEIVEEAEAQVAERITLAKYPVRGNHPQRHAQHFEKAQKITDSIITTLSASYLKNLK